MGTFRKSFLVFSLYILFGNLEVSAQENCPVPHFTATSEIDGRVFKVDTMAKNDDCSLRAKKLAFYGRWRGQMVSEEAQFYATPWITDGETEAIEMADFLAKTNQLSSHVDMLTGWLKGVEKIFFNDASKKIVTSEAVKIASKSADFLKSQLILNDSVDRSNVLGLTSEALKVIASSTECSEKRNVDSCGAIVKNALKTNMEFGKVFGKNVLQPDFERKLYGWVEFLLESADAFNQLGQYSPVTSSRSSGFMAVAAFVDVTAKASTKEYWRDEKSKPYFANEIIMAVSTSYSAWLKCKGAALSLVDERKNFLSNSAECASSTVKAGVDNSSKLFARSTVLYKASQDV